MAEARYVFDKPSRDESLLHSEIAALALPGFEGVCGSGPSVEAVFRDPLSASDQVRLSATVAAHAGTPRQPKSLGTLYGEIFNWVGTDSARLKKVACLALAEAMRRDPKLARKIGEAIDGDEPAPAPSPS